MAEENEELERNQVQRESRTALESYFADSGFYRPTMTPRGRLVAEVFDCWGEHFPHEYLEPSGHINPGVVVRLHDICELVYEGRCTINDAYTAWAEWESVLRGFFEAYGLGPLSELLLIEVQGKGREGDSAECLGPLEREVLSQAMGWLRSYIVCYEDGDLEEGLCDGTFAVAELGVLGECEPGEEEASFDHSDEEQDYVKRLMNAYRIVDVVPRNPSGVIGRAEGGR